MNVNNRWFQLSAYLTAMIMIANFQYAWTLFVSPIQRGNGWTLSAVQWAFTLFILCQTWVQPLSGRLIDRLGPRVLFTLAGLLCGAGWAGMGMISSLRVLYLLYAMAGVGSAIVYGGSIGSALKWFVDRRGLATGIIASGFGGGAALFVPIISRIIASSGYRNAFIWTGLFQGTIIILVAQFVRHPPEQARPAVAVKTTSAPGVSLSPGEMLRVPRFYLLYLIFVMMATGGLVLTAQAGPIARSWGISVWALTLTTALGPIANTMSRVSFGWLSDRIGRELSMGIGFLMNAVCLTLVGTIGHVSDLAFIVTMLLAFFTWGEMYSLFPSTLGDYFGSRYASSNYGILYTGKGVASIIGGGVAAILFEKFGSWSAVFGGGAVMALIAGVLALQLRARIASLKGLVVAAPTPVP
jgi:OFA family oxalate/formate antiporter-like MFS transporter